MDNVPAPWRARLRASAVDLMVIWAWLGSLAGLSRVPAFRGSGYAKLFRHPSTADLAQTATGVLPAALYLAIGEAGAAHATRGKRAAGLRVVGAAGCPASHAQIAVRTAVKLLPWQIAHLSINRAVGIVGGERSKKWAVAGFSTALGLVASSAATAVFRSDHRALHDLVAATRVVPVVPAK